MEAGTDLSDLRSKADLVADMLRDEIAHGHLEPGSVLRQREIATRFGVSPTPVREALSRLEVEGFVTSMLHRGATVVRQERARLEENFRIRATLEALAVELAVGRLTERDLTKLEAINKQISKHKRVTQKVVDLNRAFHMTIYEAMDSPLLLTLIRHLWRALSGGPRVHRPLQESVKQHAELIDALRRKDTTRASELTRYHIISSGPVLSEDAQEEPAAQSGS